MTTDAPASPDPVPEPDPATTSVTTEPPPPPASGEVARPEGDEPTPPRAGLVALLVAVGVGLLAAAVAVSAFYTRYDGEIDWSNYTVGLGTTVGLLLVALGAGVLVRRTPAATARHQVVTWSGAVGVLGVAAMIAIGAEDSDYLGYLIGGVVVALSAGGFLLTRGGAYVVTAILGLGLLYANGFEDVLGGALEDERALSVIAAAIAVFVVAVTVLGWLLPTRVLSALVAGWIGVVGLVQLLVVVLVMQFVQEAFGDVMTGMGPLGSESPDLESDDAATDDLGSLVSGDVETDVWVVLAIAGGLTLMWAIGAALTDRAGFTLLAVVMPAVMAPLGSVALAVEHPTWWGAALGVSGGVLLALSALLALRRDRRPGSERDDPRETDDWDWPADSRPT